MMLKRLDRFLLKSFLGPFIMVFFIVMFILVMQFLWLYIDELAGKGLSFRVILEFMWWGSCTILPMAMPLSTLLASIMTLGNMGENNELLAMKAAGIPLQRILYPLVYVAVFISVSAFFISNNLIPVSYNKIYTLRSDILRTREEIKIPSGTFYNGIEGYSLRIRERNNDTDMMYDVMIYDHTSGKGNVSVALADSGTIQGTPDKRAIILHLYNGVTYENDNTVTRKDTTLALQRIAFKEQSVIIPLENYGFEKSDSSRYGSEIMTKKLSQLRYDRDSISKRNNTINERHERSVMYDIGLETGMQLDTARNKVFVRSADVDSLLEWKDVTAELEAVNAAIKQAQRAKSNMTDYHREVERQLYNLPRINLEVFRKFTLSLACLLFFFIGAPLGAIIRKGGLGTPVIVSALFFVLYYIVDITGKKLARDGEMSPFIGAFISTFMLFPIGAFLTWAASKDKSFDLKTIGLFFKAIWKGLAAFFKDPEKARDVAVKVHAKASDLRQKARTAIIKNDNR